MAAWSFGRSRKDFHSSTVRNAMNRTPSSSCAYAISRSTCQRGGNQPSYTSIRPASSRTT